MNYIVFARKYRPQAFDEVVGQEHITVTLGNAIKQGRVAHAYLFAGPRGIGKTTTARILAKALNCEKGPTVTPCMSCPTCAEIAQGVSLDMIEIDGASNRGIDEIRNLRENIKFSPSKGRYKIYIIDEVHMLTQEAFNALLKILEEPPGHVKFIFATTQSHKVPATILSRCQRFDFRRIAVRDIVANLQKIAKAEKLNVKDDVLTLIARYADGSMRDAEVILDQITSFSEGMVSIDDIMKILGIVDEDVLFGISGAIASRDAAPALVIIERVVDEGKDIGQVITSLIEHFRNIAVMKLSKDLSALVDASAERVERYRAESVKYTIEEMLYAVYTLSHALDIIRKTGIGKVMLETAVIKLAQMTSLAPLSEVLEAIKKLPIAAVAASASPLSPRPVAGPQSRTDASPVWDSPAKVSEAKVSDGGSGQTAPSQAKKVQGGEREQAMVSTEQLPQALSINDVIGSWNSIISVIKTKKISVALYLQSGYPSEMRGGSVVIGFPADCNFHKEALELSDSRKVIEDSIREVVGVETRVIFKCDQVAKNGQPKKDDQPGLGHGPVSGPSDNSSGYSKKRPEIDPLIQDALDMFGGELRDDPNMRPS